MNQEKQRIAIATACGWTKAEGEPYWRDPQGFAHGSAEPPPYTHSLDAMHEAEECQAMFLKYDKYRQTLQDVCESTFPICATAAQRAEAFLKTLSLWEEE